MRKIRHFMPRTLFARALLIVVLPTILVQIVTAYIFYSRHWENVTRHMANALAGEIAFLAYQATSTKRNERDSLTWIFEETTGIASSFQEGRKLPPRKKNAVPDYPEFERILSERIDLPFESRRMPDGDTMEVYIQLSDGLLTFRTSNKRLESPTTSIFILWTTSASFIFLVIALVFLRNQVKPIRALAQAAESFGKGRDYPGFKPTGALEVRRAARAFLVMRERILRQIRSRTEMLAGISHDLRTPLTRMKIQLEFLGDNIAAKELSDDVSQMEYMITEYLDFARGDSGEESQLEDLAALLSGIAEDYSRMGQTVPLSMPSDVVIAVRPHAFRRMMHNLVDNALRYGGSAEIAARQSAGAIEIAIDDTGPGIAPASREEVFRPFKRLDESRNLSTASVGLGLTIARDIARSHGGNITLTENPKGGLRVLIWLPL